MIHCARLVFFTYQASVLCTESILGDIIVVLWRKRMCLEHVMRLRPDLLFPVEHSSHLQVARDCVVTSSVFIVQNT